MSVSECVGTFQHDEVDPLVENFSNKHLSLLVKTIIILIIITKNYLASHRWHDQSKAGDHPREEEIANKIY